MRFVYLIVIASCTMAQEPKNTKTDATSTISTISTIISTTSVSTTPDLDVDMDDSNTTTETTLTTICEDNSTCSLSGKESNLNLTSGPKSNTTISNVPRVLKRTEIKTFNSKNLCTCNLQLGICDINCCCDQDCSPDDRLIFHHCERDNLYYDTRYCDFMKYIYINNTQLEWHVNQNGLFCVVKSNLPASHILQREEPLLSFVDAEQEKRNKFVWFSSLVGNDKQLFNMSEAFAYGNNVWTLRMGDIQKMRLPKKFIENACIINAEILNMKNVKNICSQTHISEENTYLNLESYLQNMSIIAAPNLLNISKYKALHECPKNICLEVQPKVCNEGFNICQNVSQNDTRLKIKCNFHLKLNRNSCENVVKHVQYNFYHNGTKGYTKIELRAVLENITYDFGEQDFEYFQEFEVNFWWANQTRNFSAMLSGNPGYLIGKPILIGNLVNKGNSTNPILKMERSATSYLGAFMAFPANVHGKCLLDPNKYLSVDFGYNVLTKCKMNSTVFNRKKYLNGSEICKDVQKSVLAFWGVTVDNKTIGMFGNSNSNVPEEWTKIMYNMDFETLLNKTTGQISSSNTTLTCSGIVTNLIVDIYYSRIDYKSLLNQQKILAVTYTFGGIGNKTLLYNKQQKNTVVQLDIETQVIFYDISTQKRKQFVDPPSLEIKLPYDFFYPFIKIDSGSHNLSGTLLVWVWVCLLLILFR